MSFLNRFRKQNEPEPPPPPEPAAAPLSRAKGFVPPPPRAATVTSTDPRAVRLEQRRDAIEAAIQAVEQSSDPDSPVQQRIAVLGETLASIEDEIRSATSLEPRDLPDLPAIPIVDMHVTLEPVPVVRFTIGGAKFEYAEEIDWAERGTQIVRGDLKPVAVEVDPLIPDTIGAELRDELRDHLERSLFAFATDLRDRVIEGTLLPADPTLADLALQCPRSGDWQLWGGICLRCLAHDARLRELNFERTRILDERSTEIEDRQRQVEELPIQRRRLAQTIADLQALQS